MRVLTRAAVALGGVLLALLVAEGMLQLGAAIVRARGDRAPTLLGGGAPRLLCVGDSNTYGVYVDPTLTYPAQLQGLLGSGVEVINLGFPGLNSSRLRADLPRMLEATHPDVVLILVGVNDFWTEPAAESASAVTWRAWLWRRSRVWRLLYLLARSRRDPTVAVQRLPTALAPGEQGRDGVARIGDTEIPLSWRGRGQPVDDWADRYPANLAAMTEMARAYGADVVLLTYASGQPQYDAASDLSAAAAAALRLPLIDLRARFQTLCPTVECPDYLLRDGHPNRDGYGAVAAEVARALRARGLVASP